MSAQENKNTVIRFFQEVISGNNLDLLDELLTPDCVAHPPLPTRSRGPEPLKRQLRQAHSMFSDWEVEVHSAVAEDDEVAVRVTMHSTHVGTFMGIEPTGKRVSGPTMAFFRLEGGKIAEMWAMEDARAIAAQLEG